MAVAIRTAREIEKIRAAGQVVGRVLHKLREIAAAGVTTADLADLSDRIIAEAGGTALFKGVRNPAARFDFPASICASINEEVVHGIPSGRRMLTDGDILSIDCGVKLNGYCGDAAITLPIGRVDPEVERLLRITRQLLDIAVRESRPGRYWSEIAGRMQEHAEQAGFGVVRDYVGHGIGRQMHEDPKLPNFVSRELLGNDLLLRKGMVLAVEPMVNLGTWKVKVSGDGWTVLTADGLPSAHEEHTIAVTDDGTEILTAGPDGAE
ncbi:MAG: type I methionyl aminopeptidase [Sedimentisphaerales bacterium]|nr:type I methionyl aminopeptidase [Sedimentisphaerales bacterium]